MSFALNDASRIFFAIEYTSKIVASGLSN